MISVEINGTLYDTNELIAVTLAASEIGKLETRQGSYTNSFSLPYTAELASDLGFPDNLNIANATPYRRVDAKLVDDNQTIDTGYVQINSIENNEIKLTFFGNNSAWYSLIKDFKLTDIDLSDIDHAWSEANISGSWSNTWDDGYIYPVVDYGMSQSLASSEVINWYPAVFLRYILKKGFEDKGLKMSGDLLRDSIFNRVIIPFSKLNFINASNLLEEEGSATNTGQNFSSGVETQINFSSASDNTGGWDTGTDRFTAQVTGKHKIEINCASAFFATATTPELRIKKNGALDVTITIVSGTYNAGNLYYEYYDELTATDYLEFFIYHTSGANRVADTQVTISESNRISEGDTIEMKYTVPEIEFSDLLRWVGFTFGVVFTYDIFNKTVHFNKFSQIPFETPVDWTDKLIKVKRYDYFEPIRNYSATNTAKYEENENDIYLDAYQTGTGLSFGEGQISIENDFLTDEKEIYKSPFAGTVTIYSPMGGYIPFIQRFSSRTKVLNGSIENIDDWDSDTDPKPRVLVLHADDSLNFSPYASIAVGSTSGETSCAYATFYKSEHSSSTINGYTDSLTFSAPIVGSPNDTPIFSTEYWNRYLRILASPKFLLCEMFLTKADIATFDVTKPVFIEALSSYFYVNKIKEYAGEGLTDVELIKL